MAPAALPTARFRRVVEDGKPPKYPAGTEQQAIAWGYNKLDGEEFALPAQYIHHVEPLESELAYRVEYDLDEQDEEWLNAVNAERKRDHLDPVSYELFEVLMDRLEKEYFELIKHVPKPDNSMPAEDSTCAICDDGEGENSNVIVFCDGCNLAVHQDCYGVPYIPEGQWLCRKCTVSPESPVSCALCPNEGGAFKQTTTGQWVHLLCAIWIPEVMVANLTVMEPIENVDRIPKNRVKLTCSICRKRGPCIQCDVKACYAAFHTTCARQEKFLGPMKALPDADEAPPLRAYCEKHLPPDMVELRNEALEEQEANMLTASPGRNAKAARAHAKSYTLGPPLVPAIIVDHLMWYTVRSKVRKMKEFVVLVCKYWSLKREARRGAPLLKRLYLEPWTTSSVDKDMSLEQRVIKIELMAEVRKDLEKLRMASGMVQKREKAKKSQAGIVANTIIDLLFPHLDLMRSILRKFSDLDRMSLFTMPITVQDAPPEYFDIINTAMSWSEISDKIAAFEYYDVQSFADDIHLVLDNAMTYNGKESKYYKVAERIKKQATAILEPLWAVAAQAQALDSVKSEGDGGGVAANAVGSLEAPLSHVQLLFEAELLEDDPDLRMELGEPVLDSLLAIEMGYPNSKYTGPASTATKEATPAMSIPLGDNEAMLQMGDITGVSYQQQLPQEPARYINRKRDREREKKRQKAAEKAAARAAADMDTGSSDLRSPALLSAHGAAEAMQVDPAAELEPHVPSEDPSSKPPPNSDVEPAVKTEHLRDEPLAPAPRRDDVIMEDAEAESSVVDAANNVLSAIQTRQPIIERPATSPSTPAAPLNVLAPEASPTISETRLGARRMRELNGPLADYYDEPASLATNDIGEALRGTPRNASLPALPPTDSPVSVPRSPTPADTESSAAEPPTPRGTKRKRQPTTTVEVAPIVIPDIIADVDNRSSFALFNSGWVLDSGTKRHGRNAPDPALPPLPKKADRRKTKIAAPTTTSDLTAESSSSQLPLGPVFAAAPTFTTAAELHHNSAVGDTSIPAAVDMPPDDLSPLSPPTPQLAAAVKTAIYEPIGPPPSWGSETLTAQAVEPPTATLEALPSSATLAAEFAGLVPHLEPHDIISPRQKETIEQPLQSSRPRRGDKPKVNHTPMPPVNVPGIIFKVQSGPPKKAAKPHPPEAKVNLNSVSPVRYEDGKTMLENGTMVWGKMAGYPWYPAIVRNPMDPDVPARVREKERPSDAITTNAHLVCFESNPITWGWLTPDNMQMLGDDPRADQIILTRQHYKSKAVRGDVKKAFDKTMAQMAPEDFDFSPPTEEPLPTAVSEAEVAREVDL